MQDPSNPNSKQVKATHHRRAHSEVNFRLPEDLDLVGDPFLDEIGSEDDFFSTYMDIEKLGTGSAPTTTEFNNAGTSGLVADPDKTSARPRHRHSNSVDSSSLMLSESIEAKKAMAPDKLAELWTIDPKRAKRILANRQSASRSKERKARYITELERKVQTLQTEATTLSAQLTLFQRDTAQFTHENTELKLRLQAMAQQAQLRDALNEALKQEVERLRMATGEISSSSDAYSLGMQHIPYNHSAFFSHHQQSGPSESQNIQLPQFHSLQDSLLTSQRHLLSGHGQAVPDTMQQDPLGRFQGLDIGGRGMHLVKTEAPSISASESSSTL